jgi:hypothetical protein
MPILFSESKKKIIVTMIDLEQLDDMVRVITKDDMGNRQWCICEISKNGLKVLRGIEKETVDFALTHDGSIVVYN